MSRRVDWKLKLRNYRTVRVFFFDCRNVSPRPHTVRADWMGVWWDVWHYRWTVETNRSGAIVYQAGNRLHFSPAQAVDDFNSCEAASGGRIWSTWWNAFGLEDDAAWDSEFRTAVPLRVRGVLYVNGVKRCYTMWGDRSEAFGAVTRLGSGNSGVTWDPVTGVMIALDRLGNPTYYSGFDWMYVGAWNNSFPGLDVAPGWSEPIPQTLPGFHPRGVGFRSGFHMNQLHGRVTPATLEAMAAGYGLTQPAS